MVKLQNTKANSCYNEVNWTSLDELFHGLSLILFVRQKKQVHRAGET